MYKPTLKHHILLPTMDLPQQLFYNIISNRAEIMHINYKQMKHYSQFSYSAFAYSLLKCTKTQKRHNDEATPHRCTVLKVRKLHCSKRTGITSVERVRKPST